MDAFLAKNRKEMNHLDKQLTEYEIFRKDTLEKETQSNLEEIDINLYKRFSSVIENLKQTQSMYKDQNSKLNNEVNLLKKDKIDIINQIRKLYDNLSSLKERIGIDVVEMDEEL